MELSDLSVRCSENAESAIQLIDEQKPKIIVLEIQIAKHSGVEFLHEFRSYEDWLNVPILIYSKVPKYVFAAQEIDWDKYGVKQYLTKSKYSTKDLIEIIKREI